MNCFERLLARRGFLAIGTGGLALLISGRRAEGHGTVMQDVAPRKVHTWNAALAETVDDAVTVGDVKYGEHCGS